MYHYSFHKSVYILSNSGILKICHEETCGFFVILILPYIDGLLYRQLTQYSEVTEQEKKMWLD
jgi:hypothetical protein